MTDTAVGAADIAADPTAIAGLRMGFFENRFDDRASPSPDWRTAPSVVEYDRSSK
jgi:hypothetical protein